MFYMRHIIILVYIDNDYRAKSLIFMRKPSRIFLSFMTVGPDVTQRQKQITKFDLTMFVLEIQ